MSAYPEVNALLRELLGGVRIILGNRFVGMYLFGSLAAGDFDEASDVDVLVVTDDDVSDDVLAALGTLHARINAGGLPWADELELSYIPRQALRRYDPARALHPHLDRGAGERLRMMEHDRDWVVQRHVLRERGVALVGPTPATLIDPVTPDDLRQGMLAILRGWVAPMLSDPLDLPTRGYQSYLVLAMCRILYTLEHGAVVSKPAAARWAREAVGERWAPLIDGALAGRRSPRSAAHPDDVAGTVELLRFTVERSSQGK